MHLHWVGPSWLTQFQRQAGEWRCFVETEKLQKHVFFVKYKPHSSSLHQQWNISLSSISIYLSNLKSQTKKWLIPSKNTKKTGSWTFCCRQIYSLWNLFSIWSVSVIYFPELLVEVLLMEMEKEEWLLRVNCSISLSANFPIHTSQSKKKPHKHKIWNTPGFRKYQMPRELFVQG